MDRRGFRSIVGTLVRHRCPDMSALQSRPGADHRRATALAPHTSEVHEALGNVASTLGEQGVAKRHHLRAAALDPHRPEPHYLAALACLLSGEAAAACRSLRRAAALSPSSPPVFGNLAEAFAATGDDRASVSNHLRVLAVSPSAARSYANLAQAWIRLRRLHAATRAGRRAVALAPSLTEGHINLGLACQELARGASEARRFRRACALDPDRAEARFALASALLASGDLVEGFRFYEARWALRDPQVERRHLPFPLWDGGDARDRRILLWTEQGFGDAIHFVRYAPLLAARGARVVLECPAPLARLFQSLPGIERVVTRGEPLPEVECHAPLMSLPHLFGTTLASIPAAVPYLAPPAGNPTHPDLDKPGFRIGLVWAGSPGHKSDRTRSLGASDIRSLVEGLAGTGASLFSLQVGPRAADLAGTPVTDLTATFRDFADTAAAIAKLDLVIAVDTAVAHLAGALAKTLLVLIPHAAEWRWRDEGIETPWYPSARLLRQNRPEDWSGPIERAAEIAGSMRSPG